LTKPINSFTKVISSGKKGKSICGIITFLLNISENRFFLKSFSGKKKIELKRVKLLEIKQLQIISYS
jgi:hypothetical protein